MATDENCSISRTERARRISVMRTRRRMESQQGTATARNAMLKQERARKKDHNLSPPTLWSLAGTPHRPNPVGRGALVMWSEVDSLQVQSTTAQDRNGSGAGVGASGNGTNRITSTYGYSQAFSCAFCLQGWEILFIRMKPLVNMPPSDAHIKYWYKNGSGLNTHQCFLMC